jgi:hypothetical protein
MSVPRSFNFDSCWNFMLAELRGEPLKNFSSAKRTFSFPKDPDNIYREAHGGMAAL